MDEAEHQEYHRRLFYIGLLLLIIFFGGSAFYHYMEGWTMIDSMYFSAATMTTVGYGDITPKTDIAKLFTIFYLFISVGIAVYGLSLFASHFVEVREEEWMTHFLSPLMKERTKKVHHTIKRMFTVDKEKLTSPLNHHLRQKKR